MNKLFEWDGGVSDGYLFSYLVLNFPLFPKSWQMEQVRIQECLGGTDLIVVQPAQIISGFISFGTLHIHTSSFEPWQWWRAFEGYERPILILFQAHDNHWRYNTFDGCSILVRISHKITEPVYITTGSYFQIPLRLPGSWRRMNEPKLYCASERVFLVIFPASILTLGHRKTKLEWRTNNSRKTSS